MKNKTQERGFTLIELVVVVLIISVLVAIVAGSYLKISSNVKDSACLANLRIMDGSLTQYNLQEGVYPPLNDGDGIGLLEPYIVPVYIREIPKCPKDGLYSIRKITNANMYTECSVHGSVPR